jgi:nucleoid DNA-binding protein
VTYFAVIVAITISNDKRKIPIWLVYIGGRGYVDATIHRASIFFLYIKGGILMNKADLVSKVAAIVGTQKQAKEVVDCVLDAITDALANQDTVQIAGFGSFKVSERKARTGRNPRTGASIEIPAARVPKFSAGKALKDAVN